MKIIKVNLKEKSYDIIISDGTITGSAGIIKKSGLGNYAYIITHRSIKDRYGRLLEKTLKKNGIDFKFKLLPETEKTKSIHTAIRVIEDIVKTGKSKKIFLVAFGGGVIGDLTGFVASIYKRGIPYIQVPTTLLAQVDASIGGKTAVDLKEAKNIIGAFYQPRLVLSDISLLQSLDARQMRARLAEIIKYGIIKDKILFDFLAQNRKNILAKNKKALEFIIARSSSIKARIVEKDEK
ncbi:MAG: 3-dehydroquinate synthase, partial [Candidatus Omnitrophica bacterium]|nr:3-dehydroquinate synthase [Candidatus Omnitrophota bacterium]